MTIAEQIAGEGPYKVEQFERGVILPRGYFRVVGPTHTGLHSTSMKYAADRHCALLNAAFARGQQERWIPVSERLPEKGLTVLVLGPSEDGDGIGLDALDPDSDGVTWIEWSNAHERYISCGVPGAVGPGEEATYTHWTPIPSPPNPEQR